MDADGYLTRNVFERLYYTSTAASRGHRVGSGDDDLRKPSGSPPIIRPDSNLFRTTEAYQRHVSLRSSAVVAAAKAATPPRKKPNRVIPKNSSPPSSSRVHPLIPPRRTPGTDKSAKTTAAAVASFSSPPPATQKTSPRKPTPTPTTGGSTSSKRPPAPKTSLSSNSSPPKNSAKKNTTPKVSPAPRPSSTTKQTTTPKVTTPSTNKGTPKVTTPSTNKGTPKKTTPSSSKSKAKSPAAKKPRPDGLPSTDDLIDMIEIPIPEKMQILLDYLNVTQLEQLLRPYIENEIVSLYPKLAQPRALRAYRDLHPSSTMDATEVEFYLFFLVYFHILWEDFVFFDEDDDLRISKGEFTPVAERLELFENTDEAFAKMDVADDGFVLFDEFCAACARRKLELNRMNDVHAVHDNDEAISPKDGGDEEGKDTTNNTNSVVMKLPPEEELLHSFDYLDVNSNGMLSLAELDKYIEEQHPDWNRKSALIRAYKVTDRNNDGFIKRDEFPLFFRYIAYYNQLWDAFSGLDEDEDRRINQEEFATVGKIFGIANADAVFAQVDRNGGGYVLFDELCAYCTKHDVHVDLVVEDTIPSLDPCPTTDAKEEAVAPAEANHIPAVVPEANHSPAAIPETIHEPDNVQLLPDDELFRIFDSIDVNGNGKLSVAELDKHVEERHPEWNHKAAIMRAYKAADLNQDGHVFRNEFPLFYRFIAYYNQLWAAFTGMDDDQDRRINQEEFASVAEQLPITEDAALVFKDIDTNGGGFILFDELCAYCAKRSLMI